MFSPLAVLYLPYQSSNEPISLFLLPQENILPQFEAHEEVRFVPPEVDVIAEEEEEEGMLLKSFCDEVVDFLHHLSERFNLLFLQSILLTV